MATLDARLDANDELQLLSQYQEAVQWLESAAQECSRSENVDLIRILRGCEETAFLLQKIKGTETCPLRMAAIDQLMESLDHHRQRLLAKQQQLEQVTNGTVGHEMNVDMSSGLVNKADISMVHSQGMADSSLLERMQQVIEGTVLPSSALTFSDVAGLEEAKQALREAVILPAKYPHLFTGNRQPWRRILLYGPPGTGKTRLAQALSGEIECTFYCVSSSDLISSWVGESEKIIRGLFQHMRQSCSRAVMFIDEVDSICRRRNLKEEEHTRRVKTELLRQMEGFDSANSLCSVDFFLLCATNCPWELDPAFLRRFQKRIHIPLPSWDARLSLLRLHTKQTSMSLSEKEWQELASATEGYSGSDIANIVADSLMEPVREMETAKYWKAVAGDCFTPCGSADDGAVPCTLSDLSPSQVRLRPVFLNDFMTALSHSQRTVNREDISQYIRFSSSPREQS